MIRLKINGETLELTKGTYKETYGRVEFLKTSEHGNNLLAVVRTGIPGLKVAYTCDGAELAKLIRFSKESQIVVNRFSEEVGGYIDWPCYMKELSPDLIGETEESINGTRNYKVSFELVDLS